MSASRFRYLFNLYYSQQCTADEKQEFLSLVGQATHDAELKQLISELMEGAEEEGGMKETSANAILEAVMRAEAKPAPRIKHRSWLSIAAGVIVLLGIAGVIRFMYNGSLFRAEQQNNQVAIHPGKDRATLVLDDGTEIDLEKTGNGGVKVQQGIQAHKKGDELQYNNTDDVAATFNTIITPKGGQYRIILPDGSRVWLNAASSIRFPTVFNNSERKVEIKGEVYFDVVKNASQPFRVTNGDMEVTVLGTQFNIMAYEDENEIATTLLEGAVKVNGQLLKPGLQASINRKTKMMSVVAADLDQVIAWKEGRFEFSGNIKSIMRQISRWYNVEVEYKGNFEDKAFGGAISRKEQLGEVLKMLELTGSIHFETETNKVTVIP